jgi:hypothetical protein
MGSIQLDKLSKVQLLDYNTAIFYGDSADAAYKYALDRSKMSDTRQIYLGKNWVAHRVVNSI